VLKPIENRVYEGINMWLKDSAGGERCRDVASDLDRGEPGPGARQFEITTAMPNTERRILSSLKWNC
jgi:hypothetical protein